MSKITFHRNSAFSMRFDNGFVVSVTTGPGTYSSNRHLDTANELRHEATTAEIACWDENDSAASFVRLGEYDDVVGWVPTHLVAQFIFIVSQASNKEEIIEKVRALGLHKL
jgi:hypothetical protein